MSTSPEPPARREDAVVGALSSWLTRHIDNAELADRLRALGTAGLGPESVEALPELIAELDAAEPGRRGGLEMHVRETLELVAHGE